MSSDERRLAVLRAIVEDYVATKEPVGSKVLVERHSLGVSPATIRNDMAVLEEEGLIAQPHTSAGRVPTDAGYRLFVDRLTAIRQLSQAEKRAITSLLTDARDLDDVLERTVRLLAQLTRQVAIVSYPSLSLSTVRHIELVSLGSGRILVVVITGSGQVEQRTVVLDDDPTYDLLGELRARLNLAAVGEQSAGVGPKLAATVEQFPAGDRDIVEQVVNEVVACLGPGHEDRVVLAGTSNLVRAAGRDFPDRFGTVLDALEEQVVMLRLLGEMADDPASGLTVRIGRENPNVALQDTSVVSTGYGQGQVVARLGVLGPTRMDYPTTMAAVRAVARYLSRVV